MIHPNSFSKEQHLCGDIRIGKLFSEGEAFIVYPMRVVFRLFPYEDDISTIRTMVSVPKKRFKRAVKRNRLKRLMREAYRLNKHQLTEALSAKGFQLDLSFNYVSDEVLEFSYIEKKMKTALMKIQEKL